MSKERDMINEIRVDRKKARTLIRESVCKDVIVSANNGFLPSLDDLMDNIMNATANLLERYPHVSKEAWSVILQRDEATMETRRMQKLLAELKSNNEEPAEEPVTGVSLDSPQGGNGMNIAPS